MTQTATHTRPIAIPDLMLEPMVRAALAEDLGASQMRLAAQRLSGGAPDGARSAATAALVQEAVAARELAAVTVAVRGLATLEA